MLNFLPKLFGKLNIPNSNPGMGNNSKLKEALLLNVDRPDGFADISNCALDTIPKEFFHQCATFLKTRIICSNNKLQNLEDGGKVEGSLRRVLFLDVSFNRLEKLPLDFGITFPALVELLLDNNHLKDLPPSLRNLKSLRVLSIRCNKFSEFPEVICELTSLVELRISGNDIKILPMCLGQLEYLETLDVDIGKLIYPSQEVCLSGSAGILEKLRVDGGIKFVTKSAEKSSPVSPTNSNGSVRFDDEEKRMKSALARIKSDESVKNQEMMHIYGEIENDHRRLSESVSKSRENEQKVILQSLRERAGIELDLMKLAQKIDSNQKILAETVREMEKHSEKLLSHLSHLSDERARNVKFYEDDCFSFDQTWKNWSSSSEKIQKEQVLAALKAQLEDEQRFGLFFKHLMEVSRCDLENIVNSHRSEETKFIPLIQRARIEQDNIINSILQDENIQREMFRELQMKSDSAHRNICRDLALLENELSVLSLLEHNRTTDQAEIIKRNLEDDRLRLAELYQRLLLEKKDRENHLLNLMREMEAEAQRHVDNFWLYQYNHLMETVPATFMEKTSVRSVGEKQRSMSLDVKPSSSKIQPNIPASFSATEFPAVLRLENICIICMDHPSTEIFLPCGHICACQNCCVQLKLCPLCRTEIAQRAKLNKNDAEEGL